MPDEVALTLDGALRRFARRATTVANNGIPKQIRHSSAPIDNEAVAEAGELR
jgi:hypothetical protein